MSNRPGLRNSVDNPIFGLQTLRVEILTPEPDSFLVDDENQRLLLPAVTVPRPAEDLPEPEPLVGEFEVAAPEPALEQDLAIWSSEWEAALQRATTPEQLLALDLTPIGALAQTARIASIGPWTPFLRLAVAFRAGRGDKVYTSTYFSLTADFPGPANAEVIQHSFATQAEVVAYLLGAECPWPQRLP